MGQCYVHIHYGSPFLTFVEDLEQVASIIKKYLVKYYRALPALNPITTTADDKFCEFYIDKCRK